MWRRPSTKKLRDYAPPSGVQYELFDISWFLFTIGLVAFVIFQPPPSVVAALYGPLQVVSETVLLGVLVTVTALVGIVLSYTDRYLRIGYMVPRIGAAFMFLNFLLAVVVLAINGVAYLWGWDFIKATDLEQTFRASFIYMMIFGWAVRRLSRDEAA